METTLKTNGVCSSCGVLRDSGVLFKTAFKCLNCKRVEQREYMRHYYEKNGEKLSMYYRERYLRGNNRLVLLEQQKKRYIDKKAKEIGIELTNQ